MKQVQTLFLKSAILVLAAAMITLLRVLPKQKEGQRVDPSVFIGCARLFAFIGSTPFSSAVPGIQTVRTLIDANGRSPERVNALKDTSLPPSLIGLVRRPCYISAFFTGGEDAAGPTMLSILASFASRVIATAAAVFQKLLQNAVDIKSENDLTV
jgi:hypothetical protein